MKLNVIDLGLCDYRVALDRQHEILAAVQKGIMDDTLILVEHPPVVTLGRNAEAGNVLFSEDFLKSQGFDVYHVERGGDATYHGPGQIVGYPIFNIKLNHGKSVRHFVESLEQVFIDLLGGFYEVTAGRDDINSGVWIGKEKILAIGLAVKRGVTFHGFAFNVNTDLSHYQYIVPCGLTDRTVTSMEKLLSGKQDIETVKKQIVEGVRESFGFE
jgi:lipoyl(octanoyl) transferase